MEISFEWKNPPPSYKSFNKKLEPHFLSTAKKLIANPNKWARIATGRSLQWVKAELVQTGTELNASGFFECTVRKLPDRTERLYARWIQEVM